MSEDKVVGYRDLKKARLDSILMKKKRPTLQTYATFLKLNYAFDPAPSPQKVETISCLLKFPVKSIKSWFQRHRSTDYKANKLCNICKKFFVAEYPSTPLCKCLKVKSEAAGLPAAKSEIPTTSTAEENFPAGSKTDPPSSSTSDLPGCSSSEVFTFEPAYVEEVVVITEDTAGPLDLCCAKSSSAKSTELEIATTEEKPEFLVPEEATQQMNEESGTVSGYCSNGSTNGYLTSLPGYPLVRSILSSLVMRHRANPPLASRPVNLNPASGCFALPNPLSSIAPPPPAAMSSPLPGFHTLSQPYYVGHPWYSGEESSYVYCAGYADAFPPQDTENSVQFAGFSSQQPMWCPDLE